MLQGAWLQIFGRNLVQVGVATGIAYSLAFWFHFTVGRKVLSGLAAAAATGLLFLAHPYIVYPWSNYFSAAFTFAAVALVLAPATARSFGAAGLCLAAAYLCRHSVVLSLAPPFGVLLFSQMRSPGFSLKGACFCLGLGVPIIGFFAWLVSAGLWEQWWIASIDVNRALYDTVAGWKGVGSPAKFIVLLWGKMFFSLRPQLLVFTLVSWSCLSVLLRYGWQLARRRTTWRNFSGLPFVASVALFGFLQAGHSYELFRIATASGLGTVVAVAFWQECASRSRLRRKLMGAVAVVWGLALGWSFFDNQDILHPWSWAVVRQVSTPTPTAAARLPVFAHKALSEKTFQHYEEVRLALLRAKDCGAGSLVNLSKCDAFAYYLVDIGKPQREPCRIPWHRSDDFYPDEPLRRNSLRVLGTAAFFVPADDEGPPGYFRATTGGSAVVWLPERCR